MHSHLVSEHGTEASSVAGRGEVGAEERLLQHCCGDEQAVDLREQRVGGHRVLGGISLKKSSIGLHSTAPSKRCEKCFSRAACMQVASLTDLLAVVGVHISGACAGPLRPLDLLA
jgi:hypothetical protein